MSLKKLKLIFEKINQMSFTCKFDQHRILKRLIKRNFVKVDKHVKVNKIKV